MTSGASWSDSSWRRLHAQDLLDRALDEEHLHGVGEVAQPALGPGEGLVPAVLAEGERRHRLVPGPGEGPPGGIVLHEGHERQRCRLVEPRGRSVPTGLQSAIGVEHQGRGPRPQVVEADPPTERGDLGPHRPLRPSTHAGDRAVTIAGGVASDGGLVGGREGLGLCPGQDGESQQHEGGRDLRHLHPGPVACQRPSVTSAARATRRSPSAACGRPSLLPRARAGCGRRPRSRA